MAKLGVIDTPQQARERRIKEQQAAIAYWDSRVQAKRVQWDKFTREAFDRNHVKRIGRACLSGNQDLPVRLFGDTVNKMRSRTAWAGSGVKSRVKGSVCIQSGNMLAGDAIDGAELSANQKFPIRLPNNSIDKRFSCNTGPKATWFTVRV